MKPVKFISLPFFLTFEGLNPASCELAKKQKLVCTNIYDFIIPPINVSKILLLLEGCVVKLAGICKELTSYPNVKIHVV